MARALNSRSEHIGERVIFFVDGDGSRVRDLGILFDGESGQVAFVMSLG